MFTAYVLVIVENIIGIYSKYNAVYEWIPIEMIPLRKRKVRCHVNNIPVRGIAL